MLEIEMTKRISIEKDGVSSFVYFKDSSKMNEISDEQITLIITSPPYFNLKDYSVLKAQNGQLSASQKNILKLIVNTLICCLQYLRNVIGY